MNRFIQFLAPGQDLSVAYLSTYNMPLVTLSVLTAVFASFMALELSGRIAHATTAIGKILWMAPGALALGGGVWAMHFIGMLAFNLPCGISYDPIQTLISIVPGVVASAAALWVISRTNVSYRKLGLGSILMGGGIGTMHYSGMAAMRLDAVIYYSPALFALSIGFAVVLAFLSLHAKFVLHRQDSFLPKWARSIFGAVFMGVAISGMHYIAMEAAYFIPVGDSAGAVAGISPTVLAVGISMTTLMLVALTLTGSVQGRHLETIHMLEYEIRERKQAEERLLEAKEEAEKNEQKLRSIVNASNVTAILSIDDEGNLTTWNPGAEKAFGFSEDEILGKPLTSIIPDRYRDAHMAGLKRATVTDKYNVIGQTVELSGLHKNGHEFPLELSLGVWEFGKHKYFSAVINDITERMQADERIHQLAYTDSQTGLPNEAYFLEQLNETLNQDRQGFVASIELSGIGDIVGTFGLEASELIFYELGKRLSDQMNDQSIAARAGPRLFKIVYVIDEVEGDALYIIANRLFRIAQESFDLMGADVFVNVFMGVSVIDPNESTPKSILTDVEIAHHEATKSTASSIVYFNNSIKEKLVRTTQIVSLLHSAIRNNEFKLFFQPQVNLKTNTIVGCEALIRWPSSTEEWISPGEFIPIAEKAGLIGEITRWTVDEAYRTAKSWITEQELKIRVGVNISAEELASPYFLDYVSKFIEEAKLPPESLEIEITETALMKDADVASKNLKKLRDLGATVAIDDFGTGQASLAYLKNFPIDRLKIDQSFVKGALTNKTDREIIVSVIKLAHSLGMEVIAEGAEEKEHIDLLVSLGCDEVQGYFIAKPMPVDQFVEFVNAYSRKRQQTKASNDKNHSHR